MLSRYLLTQLRSFDLWIGANFETTFPHLLILADSTYGHPSLLSNDVPRWIAGKQPDTTFSAIYNACTTSKAAGYASASKLAFWDSIAFYNFVPGTIGIPSTSQPTTAALKSGIRPLHLLLDALRPDGVFIFGLRHSNYSRPVVHAHGIPYVVVPHTRSGVSASFIAQSWDVLLRIAVA